MKDPAFLFYPNDWLGGTLGMSFEEKGAYMEILMLQFNRGHMTEHMIGQVIGQLWVNIKDKFIQDDKGLYFNERLDIEKEKRKKYTQSRRNNVSGVNQHTKRDNKDVGHKGGHMTPHMENENINENESINIKEREIKFIAECKKHDILKGDDLQKFILYWTESSGKKLRFEKEKTWNIEKRMQRWVLNNKEWNHGTKTTDRKDQSRFTNDPADWD